jgi:Cu/Ag efflux protein CusF
MRWLSVSVVTLVGITLASGLALGQAKPDCTPHKVEGRVVKVDMDGGKLTLQEANGKTFEFQAPKDVLQDKKVGDRLEINKRLPDGCK